jgi:hypothetical protein
MKKEDFANDNEQEVNECDDLCLGAGIYQEVCSAFNLLRKLRGK